MRARGQHVDRATIVGTTTIPANPPPAVDTSAFFAQAHDAFDATISLPPAPTGLRSCPNDPGIAYVITFYDQYDPVMVAVADPYGCSEVHLDAPGMPALSGDPQYYRALAAAFALDATGLPPFP